MKIRFLSLFPLLIFSNSHSMQAENQQESPCQVILSQMQKHIFYNAPTTVILASIDKLRSLKGEALQDKSTYNELRLNAVVTLQRAQAVHKSFCKTQGKDIAQHPLAQQGSSADYWIFRCANNLLKLHNDVVNAEKNLDLITKLPSMITGSPE